MMLQKLEIIMNEAMQKKNYTQRGNVSNNEILNLENQLKVLLPDDYRVFLENYGYCFWFGGVICGLVGDNKRFEKLCCVFKKNKYYHEFYDNDPSYLSVPSKGLVIGKWAGGGYYFLFSQESERAGEVGLFLTETFGQEVSSFSSFTDYLSFLVLGSPDPVTSAVDYDKINEILDN